MSAACWVTARLQHGAVLVSQVNVPARLQVRTHGQRANAAVSVCAHYGGQVSDAQNVLVLLLRGPAHAKLLGSF
jgi:hypothetical protein